MPFRAERRGAGEDFLMFNLLVRELAVKYVVHDEHHVRHANHMNKNPIMQEKIKALCARKNSKNAQVNLILCDFHSFLFCFLIFLYIFALESIFSQKKNGPEHETVSTQIVFGINVGYYLLRNCSG